MDRASGDPSDLSESGRPRPRPHDRRGGENALRHIPWFASIAGAILLVQAGAIFYYFVSSRPASQAQASRLAALEADNATLREANTALRETNTRLEQQRENMTKEQTRLRDEMAGTIAVHQKHQTQKTKTSRLAKGRTRTTAPATHTPQPATPPARAPDDAIPGEALQNR